MKNNNENKNIGAAVSLFGLIAVVSALGASVNSNALKVTLLIVDALLALTGGILIGLAKKEKNNG